MKLTKRFLVAISVLLFLATILISHSFAAKKKITLELKEADVRDALRILSRESGLSIVAAPEVSGRVTVSLQNLPAEEALQALLQAGELGSRKVGPIIRVFPLFGKGYQLEEEIEGHQVKSFALSFVEPENLKETVQGILPGTRVLVTPGSNTVIVDGTAKSVQDAARVIRSLDHPPRQVLVDAKIIEVNVGTTSQLGLNLADKNVTGRGDKVETAKFAQTPAASAQGGLFYSLSTAKADVLLETLQSRTGFNLLSNPRVLAIHGQKAEIITGSKLGYKVKSITPTGVIESVEFLDVGTKLLITPEIKENGYIRMAIHPEVSDGTVTDGLPQKRTTETTTALLVKDGQTIIIGGLIRNFDQEVTTGVPILSDIPLLGALFRKRALENTKREILVFITPRIVSENTLAEMETETEKVEKAHEGPEYPSPQNLVR